MLETARERPQSFQQRVIRSFLWMGGGQVLGQAATWLATLVVIRLLTPMDYGLMAMAMIFLGFLFVIADLGIGAAAVQTNELAEEELRTMTAAILLTSGTGFVLTQLAAPWLADFFHEPRVTPIVRVLSLNFPLMAIYHLPQARLVRELEFDIKARVDVLVALCSAGTSLTMALLGTGVWALVGGVLAQNAARALFFQIARPTPLIPDFRRFFTNPLVQFGVVVTLDRILYFMYSYADVTIGGRVLGKEIIGLYTVAVTVTSIPVQKVMPIVNQITFAAFSRIQTEGERVRRNVLRAVQFAGLLGFPTFFGMAAVAPDFVPLLLGAQWMEAIVPLQLLCLVVPLKMFSTLIPPALFGIGRPAVNLVNVLIVFLVMTAALLIGVNYGLLGLCLAWVIGFPIAFGITTTRALHALQLGWRSFIGQIAIPVLASLAMAVTVGALRHMLVDLLPTVPRLITLIATGVLVYAALILLTARSAVTELQKVLQR